MELLLGTLEEEERVQRERDGQGEEQEQLGRGARRDVSERGSGEATAALMRAHALAPTSSMPIASVIPPTSSMAAAR